MLRQAENKVRIVGILSQINLNYGSYMRDGKTVENIGGSINVKVNNGDSVLDIPVHMFSTKYTKTGNINPAYESIEKVMKEYVSIAACGNEEGADKVRLTGDIRMNDFIGRDGTVVSQTRISANFVNKVYGDFKPEATFSLEFVVQNIVPVTDREGVEVEPKKLKVTTIVPQYGEKVDVVPLIASAPGVVSAIESYWEPNKSYKCNGMVNFTATTEEYEEAVDFGEPIKKVRTISINELVITGGSQSPLDDTMEFSHDAIQTALTQRAATLEEKKNKVKSTPLPTKSDVPFDLGF